MSGQATLDIGPPPTVFTAVSEAIRSVFDTGARPEAGDFVEAVSVLAGLKERWWMPDVIAILIEDPDVPWDRRRYLSQLIESGDLQQALDGTQEQPGIDAGATIDELVRSSQSYRGSKPFREMVEFMGRFREYSPYNVMLVRLQNPSCSFFATARDWERRFRRRLVEDARPLLILAPMHPVMLVYDLDQTHGKALPKELLEFSKFEGDFDDRWLDRLIRNAERRDGIRIEAKPLSSSHSGFAQVVRTADGTNYRIVVHNGLDAAGRFGVLCHELAHIYLGHLGGHKDRWWPCRQGLNRAAVEIEAEAVAYVVACHFGLSGSSPAYLSRYLKGPDLPPAVSVNLVAKVAGRLKEMSLSTLAARPPKKTKPSTAQTAGATS